MAPVIAASAGPLIAGLWFDLMFDVQVWPHRPAAEAPDSALASSAAYYRRVTTDASPMGRLVSLIMAVLLIGLTAQAVSSDAPICVSAVSFPCALLAISLAALRVFGRARRLGSRADSPAVQSRLARSILRDHLVCLAAMSVLLTTQIIAA